MVVMQQTVLSQPSSLLKKGEKFDLIVFACKDLSVKNRLIVG